MAKKSKKWSRSVGRDAFNLDTSAAEWLGKRLIFLAKHGEFTDPPDGLTAEQWRADVLARGHALRHYGRMWELDAGVIEEATLRLHARNAIIWFAENLDNLWSD
jgi:hypothetical protein